MPILLVAGGVEAVLRYHGGQLAQRHIVQRGEQRGIVAAGQRARTQQIAKVLKAGHAAADKRHALEDYFVARLGIKS